MSKCTSYDLVITICFEVFSPFAELSHRISKSTVFWRLSFKPSNTVLIFFHIFQISYFYIISLKAFVVPVLYKVYTIKNSSSAAFSILHDYTQSRKYFCKYIENYLLLINVIHDSWEITRHGCTINSWVTVPRIWCLLPCSN